MTKKRVIVQINEDKLQYPFKVQELAADASTEEEYEVKPGFAAIDCINCGEEAPLSEAVVQSEKDDWTHVETTDQIETGPNGHYYWKPQDLDVYCSQQCAVASEL